MEKDSNEFTFELTDYKSIDYEKIFENNNKFIGKENKNQNKDIREKYEKLIKKTKTKLTMYEKYNSNQFTSFNSFIIEQLKQRIANYELILKKNKFYEEEITIFNLGEQLNNYFKLIIKGKLKDKDNNSKEYKSIKSMNNKEFIQAFLYELIKYKNKNSR